MNDRLRNIMSNLFGIPIEEINEKISIENCDQWDSFQQMSLLLAIEEDFGVNLNDDEVIKMTDFKSIISILESHGIQ